jgi:hypothetical protein
MTTQTIRVSDGAIEYTFESTLHADHDISGDTIVMSLGSSTAPDSWVAPSVDEPQTDNTTRVVQLLVDDATEPGTYYLWLRLTDTPEVVPRRGHRVVVV